MVTKLNRKSLRAQQARKESGSRRVCSHCPSLCCTQREKEKKRKREREKKRKREKEKERKREREKERKREREKSKH